MFITINSSCPARWKRYRVRFVAISVVKAYDTRSPRIPPARDIRTNRFRAQKSRTYTGFCRDSRGPAPNARDRRTRPYTVRPRRHSSKFPSTVTHSQRRSRRRTKARATPPCRPASRPSRLTKRVVRGGVVCQGRGRS